MSIPLMGYIEASSTVALFVLLLSYSRVPGSGMVTMVPRVAYSLRPSSRVSSMFPSSEMTWFRSSVGVST